MPPTRILRREAVKKERGGRWGYFRRASRVELAIPWYSYLFFTAATLLVGSLTLVPLGIISKFHHGQSSRTQRVWILSWIVFGFAIGTLAGWFTSVLGFRTWEVDGFRRRVKVMAMIAFAAFFAAPGIGGFVMVGKMLRDYGDCVTLF